MADPALPLIPGHQAVGVVSQVGAGVIERTVGERVGIAWLQHTCGVCEFCTSGRENLCEHARFTGYQVDGGYAEYALVPAAFAYPIPFVFSDAEAAPLLCAGIIGYRALRLSGIKPGQRLGLYEFGASAYIAIQIARSSGCQVYVSSLKAEHQRLARELGAVWVGGRPTCRRIVSIARSSLRRQGHWFHLPCVHESVAACRLAGIHMTPIPSLDYDREVFGERVIRSVTANTGRRV